MRDAKKAGDPEVAADRPVSHDVVEDRSRREREDDAQPEHERTEEERRAHCPAELRRGAEPRRKQRRENEWDRLRERTEAECEAADKPGHGVASTRVARSLVGDERPQSEGDEEPDEHVDVLVLADEQDRNRIEADPHDQQPPDRSRGREARQHQVEHHDDRALCRDQRDSHRQEERDVQRACDVIDQPDDDQRERRPLDDRRRDVRVRSARQRLRDRSPAVEIVGVRGLRPGCDDDGPNGPRAAEHDEEVRCRRRKPAGPSTPRQRHARASGSVRIRRQPATSTTSEHAKSGSRTTVSAPGVEMRLLRWRRKPVSPKKWFKKWPSPSIRP